MHEDVRKERLIGCAASAGGKWSTYVVTNLSASAIVQKHFVNFFMEYKGMSLTGREAMKSMGITSGKDSYFTWKKRQHDKSMLKSRYI